MQWTWLSMANKPTDVFKLIDMTPGPDKCWPWKGVLARNGRPYFTLNGKKRLAYDVVRELVTGVSLKPGELNRHSCDHEWCCNWRHLTVGTHIENMMDMKQRERHGLPHHTVKAIKRLLAANRTHQEIADLYGISREEVSAINQGRVYQHVKEEGNGSD